MCHYFRVSRNFILEKAMPQFSVETFCLALSKNFVGGPFCVTTNFWYRKKIMEKRGEEGGSIKIFRQTFFCLSAEKFVGDSFSVSLFSGIETFYTCNDFATIFCRNFLSRNTKIFVGEPLCVSPNFWYRKILWKRVGGRREGVSRFSLEFFLSQCQKNLWGTL